MDRVNRRIFVMSMASAGLAACSGTGALAPAPAGRNAGRRPRRRRLGSTAAMDISITNYPNNPSLHHFYVIGYPQGASGGPYYWASSGQWTAFPGSGTVPHLTPDQLSDAGLPATGGPGARLYVSNQKLPFSTSAQSFSPWKNDASADILWDWLEYQWTDAGAAMFVNFNADMMGVPLFIYVDPDANNMPLFPPPYGNPVEGVGFQLGADAWASITGGLTGSPFSTCIMRDTQGRIVRAISAGHASVNSPSVWNTYFDPYITDVLAYFNTPEISRQFMQYSDPYGVWGVQYQPANGLVFSPPPGRKGFTLPNSFLTAQNLLLNNDQIASYSFLPTGPAASSVLDSFFACFNRGVLTTTPYQPNYNASQFYHASAVNMYAKLMHANSAYNLAYGFPYDDSGSFSSTLTNTSGQPSLRLHIGAMTGWSSLRRK